MLAKRLLAIGAAMPLAYFVSLFGVGSLHTGYSHTAQAPSDLGAHGAPFASLFNAGLGIAAACGFAAALGLFLGFRRAGAGTYVSLMTGLSLALLSFALLMSAIFPLPDPRHYGFNLYFAGLLTPLFGVLALRGVKDAGGARVIVLLGLIASFAIVLAIFGLFGAADETNSGLWVRALAAANFGTIGFLCWTVLQRQPD
ncbi:MAG: DUF998 domain-containing protein [Hyphomonadaceae bacterium]|nr:DUF998 domain-containing protein [Hyphomonadaceae bacterium]